MKIPALPLTVGALWAVGTLIPPPVADDRASPLKRSTGEAVFQQLIDHSDPSLGTFAQRYWWSDQYYAGPGSPVVFFTPGEISADGYQGYLTNATITGLMAKAIGGAGILLEHRYWGTSSPFQNLTTKNLQYLTLENSIKDTTYFANNVQLPFDTNGTSKPSKAPWVFSGGSYSGALAAWTNAVDPGTFWATHASSAVVEAIGNFWQYFEPVRQGMPQNCSADVSRVVDHVDSVMRTGSDAEKQALKTRFGFGGLDHDDDFGSTLQNGLWAWQGHSVSSGYSSFYQFCDYVENMWPNSNNREPGAHGVGLEKALVGYAKWTNELLIPGGKYYLAATSACESYGYWTGEDNIDCFDSYNASSPIYTDVSLDNAVDRQWEWMLCNEPFKYWQDGAPEDVPSLVSRLVDVDYWQRQCGLFFPAEDGYTYGIAKGKTEADVNAYTGGWDYVNTARLIWTNGQWDPWRDSTVSSDFRPGGPLQSTSEAPVYVIPGGIHCSDLLARNGAANAGVQKIIDEVVATIKGWVDEFPASK
ncbi:endoprotease endo-Pro [Thozetella sp. PMI_491]|nr:endoprotease endo-Pro [Thozetella sp. PMI_491]